MAVVGDGGFQMTQMELATAAQQKTPVKILVLDNGYLGMVRQWQEMFFDDRLSGVDLAGNPDFMALAQCYGVKGYFLDDTSQLDEVLQEALAYTEGPCLIHAKVEKQQNVFPMVPAGKSLRETLMEGTK